MGLTPAAGTLSGMVAVVTGGASGIGRGIVEEFLEQGARVVIADLNEGTGAIAVDELCRHGHRADVRFVRADVSVEADVARAVDVAVEQFGALDCIVNNAGVLGAMGPIVETEVEDWDLTLGLLLRSAFLGIKHGARVMIPQGRGGTIVNTASVAAVAGGSGPVAYAAAKAGVVNLTRYAAVELGPHRIRVNAICPGLILTAITRLVDPEEAAEEYRTKQPWPDHGQPRHIATVASFLASRQSEFITGEAIVVDGGLVAAGTKMMLTGGPSLVHLGSTGLSDLVRAPVAG